MSSPIIIAVASAKGGCGKTTTAILLGAELALSGHRVQILDADINQHAAAFGQRATIQGLGVTADIHEGNLLPAMRAAVEQGAEIIITDLPGGTSLLAFKAFQKSHLVLIPAQASLPDVKDAVKTVAQVDDAQEMVGYAIPRLLLWTRLPAGFESRAARHVREHVEQMGHPLMQVALMERAPYREMHLTGQVPRQSEPDSKAAANVTALADELLRHLGAQA
jgi:chromosome partitioning protein